MTVAQTQEAIFKAFEVPLKDQVVYKSQFGKLTKLAECDDELLFTQTQLVGAAPLQAQNFDASRTIELVLVNKAISTESEFERTISKDLSKLENLLTFVCPPIFFSDLSAGKSPAQPMSFDSVEIPGISPETLKENYDFEKVRQLSGHQVCQSWMNAERLQLVLLQTIEQLYFANLTKMKTGYRKFKGLAKMCLQEMKHFDRVTNVYTALKSTSGERNKNFLAAPSDQLRVQFDNLTELANEILRLYGDGIQRLKNLELHPKLQGEGKTHLIDIYYKEEQMNQFRDSLTR